MAKKPYPKALRVFKAAANSYQIDPLDEVQLGGTNDVWKHVEAWRRDDHVRQPDELILQFFPGNPWHVQNNFAIGQRLNLVYDDDTERSYRIREIGTGSGTASALSIRAWLLDTDLAESQFRYIEGPTPRVSYDIPLTNRTVQQVLDIIFDSDYGIGPIHKLGTVLASLASLSVGINATRSSHMQLLAALIQDIETRHGLTMEYDAVYTPGTPGFTNPKLTYNFSLERGWTAAERTAGVPDPDRRPIEAPKGKSKRRIDVGNPAVGDPTDPALSTANRVFARVTDEVGDYLSRLIPSGGPDDQQLIGIGTLFHKVASMVYAAGPNETTITFDEDIIYLPDVYASPAGVSHSLTGENVLTGEETIISVSEPNVIVVLGDVTSETGGWKVLDSSGAGKTGGFGGEVTYVYDPGAEATSPQVERQIWLKEVSPYDNLFVGPLMNGSGDMSAPYTAGLSLGLVLIGTPTVAEETAEEFVRDGTSSQKVSGTTDEGVKTVTLAFVPVGLEPFLSFYAVVRVVSGSVRAYFEDDAATPNRFPDPDTEEEFLALADTTMAIVVGGLKPPASTLTLNFVIQEPGTVFYIDSIAITQSVGPWSYALRMGPIGLYLDAAEILKKNGGLQPVTFVTQFIDVTHWDETNYDEILCGSHARIKDLFDVATDTAHLDLTGRAEMVSSGGPGPRRNGSPWRTARFARARPSLTTRLAPGVTLVEGPETRTPPHVYLMVPPQPKGGVSTVLGTTFIQDADTDTGVYTEKTADKDAIEYFTAGVQRAAFYNDGQFRFSVEDSSLRFVDVVDAPTKVWLALERDATDDQFHIGTDATELILFRRPTGFPSITIGTTSGNDIALAPAAGGATYISPAQKVNIAGVLAPTRTLDLKGDLRLGAEGVGGLLEFRIQTATFPGDPAAGFNWVYVRSSDTHLVIEKVGGAVVDLEAVAFPLLAPSDTAGAPSYSWSGDTDKGMYNAAPDVLAFATAGLERMVIEASGKVGIGITAPSGTLHVVRDGAANIRIDSYGTNVQVQGRTAGGTKASPSPTPINTILLAMAGRGFAASVFTSTAAQIAFEAAELFTGTAEGTRLTFDVTPLGSTTRGVVMCIEPSGNVGIGTTDPLVKLQVAGEIRAGAGTAAVPAYSFTTDIDSGLFLASVGNVALSISGVTNTTFSAASVVMEANLSLGIQRYITIHTPNAHPANPPADNIRVYGFSSTQNELWYRTAAGSERGLMYVTAGSTTGSGRVVMSPGFLRFDTSAVKMSTTNARIEDIEALFCDQQGADPSPSATVGAYYVKSGLPFFRFSTGSAIDLTAGGTTFPLLAPTSDTAAAPSYSWSGDADTGMYNKGANILAFATSGVERLDINSSTITSTLLFQAPFGSVGAPAFGFDGDSDTGMYRNAANSIGLATSGVRRLTISTASITTTLLILNTPGSATNPAYSFAADSNTGMYRIGSDRLGFAALGILGLEVAASDVIIYKETRIDATLTMSGVGVNILLTDGDVLLDSDNGKLILGEGGAGADGSMYWTGSLLALATGGTVRLDIDAFAVTASVEFRAPNGSAGSPGYTFESNQDTGMYRAATNRLGFSTGSIERVTIDSTDFTSTVPVRGPNGSAGAPAYSFTGDTNTGMYRIASDRLGFAALSSLNFEVAASDVISHVDFTVHGNITIDSAMTLSGSLNHDGTLAGFYATAPIVKQLSVPVTVAGVHAAMVNLGFIT